MTTILELWDILVWKGKNGYFISINQPKLIAELSKNGHTLLGELGDLKNWASHALDDEQTAKLDDWKP